MRERIWLEEQKAEEEERRLEQWRKEIDEERQMQELQRLKEEAGHVPRRAERLDWMYASGPSQVKAFRTAEQEAYLLGKKRVDDILDKAGQQDLDETKANSTFTGLIEGTQANSLRDTQAKIREDPLLLIKRKEQQLMNSVLDNPLKVKQMERKYHHRRDDREEHRHRSSRDSERRLDSPERRRHHHRSQSPPRRSRYYTDDQQRSGHHLARDRNERDNHRHSSPQRRFEYSPEKRHHKYDGAHSKSLSDANQDNKEQERQRKLQAMTDNAKQIEQDRQLRLNRIANQDLKDEQKDKNARALHFQGDTKSSFIRNTELHVYSGSSTMDLSERLRRQRGQLLSLKQD